MEEMINIKIKMDFREQACDIEKILSDQYNIKVLKEMLPVGDYIVNDEIVIERKTTSDFAQSIVDGRLFKQVAQMKKFFDSVLIIIEGYKIYEPKIDIHPNAIKGALVSLTVRWRVPLLFSKNNEETASLLYLIGKQTLTKNEISYRPGRRPKKQRKHQLYILQGLPQVGPKLAGKLLDYFGSVEKVITASEEELQKIAGLGKIKAQKIRNVVKEERAKYGR